MGKLNRMLWVAVAVALLLLPVAGTVLAADKFKPFVLAYRGAGDFSAKVEETKQALTTAGFEMVGEYAPFDGAHVLIFTNGELKTVASKSEYGGFAAPWRAAITKSGDEVQVAYVNPRYLAYAYRLDDELANISSALEGALGSMEVFGSKDGLSQRKLNKYNYTFGMEYFNDPYELAEYGSHAEAVAAVKSNLASNSVGIRELYQLEIPGKQEVIFGVSMNAPSADVEDMDDKHQMDIVDFEELRKVAYLPYEIMVTENRVVALHMRFRMAVHFPDLKMMGANSFMKLMSSPEAIRKALTLAVGGEVSE